MNLNIYSLIVFVALLFSSYKYWKENNGLKEKINSKEEKINELKKDIKKKLEKARNVHSQLLPKKLDKPDDFLISDYYQPAEFIGGDYYNVFQIDHESMNTFFDQYLIYFFDVSGHGIDSTLLSIFINDIIENYFKLKHNPGEMISTKEIMAYIDEQYQNEEFPDDYLVCLYIGLLDREKSELSYSSRGFQFPFFKINPDKNIEKIEIGGLPISTAIGSMPENNFEKNIDVEENTKLIFSTDGLLEQGNENENYYQKIDRILEKYNYLAAPFFRDVIKKDFYNFTDNKPVRDDITYLVVEHKEKIKKWNLTKDNNKFVYEKIIEEINKEKSCLDDIAYKNLKNLLSDLIFTENNFSKIANPEIQFVNDPGSFVISFEVNSNNFSLDKISENKGIEMIKYMDILNGGNILVNKKNIYLSCSRSKNKIYLSILKKERGVNNGR